MLCIIGAIKEEISGIKQHVTIKKKSCPGTATFYEGFYKDKEIVIIRSGVGQEAAHRAVSEAVRMFPFKKIISIGFAGGLTPKLEISDLILSENVFFCNEEESLFHFNKVSLSSISLLDGNNQLCKLLSEGGIKFNLGNILSVNKVVGSAKLKEWLGKNYPVTGVEMETASIAKIAIKKGIPLYSLRSISDEVSHSLIPTEKYINKEGRINRFGLGCYFLTHPSLIPRAIELKKNVSQASKVLTDALLKII